jgi:hypothetical protein
MLLLSLRPPINTKLRAAGRVRHNNLPILGLGRTSDSGPRLKNPQRSTSGPLSEGLPTSFARFEFLRSSTRPDFPPCSERLQPPPLRSRTSSAICGHRKWWRSHRRLVGVAALGGPMLSDLSGVIPALTQPERLAPRSSWTRPVPRPSALGPSPSTGGLRPSRPAWRALRCL